MANHTMNDAAVALHEYYTSLLRAGFSREEALYLTAELVKSQGGKQ